MDVNIDHPVSAFASLPENIKAGQSMVGDRHALSKLAKPEVVTWSNARLSPERCCQLGDI